MKRIAVVVVVAVLGLLGFATPAFAHNQLIASNPVDSSSVEEGPAAIELTFDQPVQKGDGLNTVAVTGPDGTNWRTGDAEVTGNVVVASLDPLGPEGDYTIGYRILSADGHSVSGEVRFTLTQAGDGSPAPATAAGSVDPTGGSSSGDGGLPIWVWIAGAVVVLGAGLTVALRMGDKQPR